MREERARRSWRRLAPRRRRKRGNSNAHSPPRVRKCEISNANSPRRKANRHAPTAVVSAEAFVEAENAAREAALELRAAREKRAAQSGSRRRRRSATRREPSSRPSSPGTAMEDAKENAESTAVAAYEREISNLKTALEGERARAKESNAELQRDASNLRSELGAANAAFELERKEFARREFTLVESVQELSSRAALYDKAFAENRHLHNAIQDLKGSIRVFCRVEPHLPGADGGERTSWRFPAT